MLRGSSIIAKRCNSSTAGLLKTPLYDSHVKFGGKIVPYAGFAMPVLYSGQSHIESHLWVREKCGLFDVSHMLQHRFSGPESVHLLEKITPIDLLSLQPFSLSLTVLLNSEGGVIDDCIITKHGENDYYMVTNAGCRDKDVAFIRNELERFEGVEHTPFEGTLLAVQGPKAKDIISKFTNEDLSKITFGNAKYVQFSSLISSNIHLARSGYTGEDGFELLIPSATLGEAKEAQDFFNTLVEEYPEIVKPIGLAARDSLRLEAGMCLYGHELNENTTPVEATLLWLIPKLRRNAERGTFNGASKILEQIADKSLVKYQRVGLTSKGPSPRDNNKVFDKDGQEVGYITSGLPSPSLGGNVAQAFIKKGSHKSGTELDVEIRGKKRPAVVTKMPFVPNNFYRG